MATNLLAQLRKDNPRYAHYDDDQFIDLISSQAGIPRSQLMQRIGGEEQSNTTPTSSPTSVIDKLRADNPRYRHYSDEQWVSLIAENTNSTFEDAASMLGYQPPEPEPISDSQEKRPSGFTGMLGNVVRGAKQAGRSIGAMGNTITGDLAAVEDYARRSQESAEKEMPEEQRQLHSELQAIDREQGAMGQIGDTLGAAARNPMGTAQLITEQIPNSAVSLGSGWAGFKTGAALGAAAGPVGAGIGGTLGFLGGMFLGNYMLEGGSKAIEKAEGGFTEDERRETLTEGAKKAGVITAVDAATFKAGSMIANRLGGAAAVKNGAKAEAEVLMKAGVDMSSPATINAALAKSPELMKQAKIAGERAAINTLSRSKKAGIAGTGLSLETVGEGAGEYLGEMAATGEGDVVDATIEALAGFSQSAVQTAYNYNRLGNKLDSENIRRQAEEINQAKIQEGINNIANAETVDEAIQAAADTAAQKPVSPGDVMDDIAYREELLKRTEAFTQGGANEETQQEASTQPIQATEVLGAQPKTARDTEIVLPDNTNLPAQWDVIDASQVQATMKEGENQPRDRTRTASESQIAGIANDPNYALVSDSPVMDVGAPVLDNNGVIVAGNGRFEGLSRAYQLGTATQYKERLMADAARKGIDPAVVASMEQPVLVRRVMQPIDTRKTAIKSNSGLGLQYSALELAKIDAERMKNLSDIEVSDNGDIVLNAQNIQNLRSALSDYDASELGALVDKDGMLSQEGVRRVKSAILHSAYGDSPTLGRMIESTDNDIRNITGALTKSAAKVAKVRNDIKQGAIPEELDITNDLIGAVEKLAELKARSQPVDNYLAQQGLFGENITPESREFIQFLSNNMRSQKKLTEFINSVYDSIGSIDTSTPDIFGDTPIPSKQDVIQHAKQRKDPGQQDGATDSGTAQQSQTRSENQRDPQERSGQGQKDERLIPVSKRGKNDQPSEETLGVEAKIDNSYTQGNLFGATQAGLFDEELSNNDQSENQEIIDRDRPTEQEKTASSSKEITDFGEKLGGARKDLARSLNKEWSDEEIATEPFSKLWPAIDVHAIDDAYVAAAVYAARELVPAKPRTPYKIAAWVKAVKTMRGIASLISSESNKERFREFISKQPSLSGYATKVRLLEQIDRDSWKRIGNVSEYPHAYSYGENGQKIPKPQVTVKIDDRTQTFYGDGTVEGTIEKIKEALTSGQPQEKKMAFEVRGRPGSYFINKKGDREYRKLKTFTDSKEAFDYIKNNHDDLVSAWENVKESDNVKKSDVRRSENRPRTSEDYRKGKDVTPEQFQETFGFRGVEFGNWVSQGKNAKERQGMLNEAYDALMDLANIINVPPKALSLNGDLGLGFGSRGSGSASAHFEPNALVINLTKTRGAGNLAHEWFHALDNYFSRQRAGDKSNTREDHYITYRPEPLYVHRNGRHKLPLDKLEMYRKSRSDDSYWNEDNWSVDPSHPQGVRPEVEAKFADLVNALNASPLQERARLLDKSKTDGYWSRIIEVAARSFENYVIHKMMINGYHNDYLANVTPADEFVRDNGRYPYLLENEIQPVAEAFDNLFGEIKTRETERGIALYQRKSSYNPNNLSLDLGTRNLDLDYGEIEQRPGTTEKQREIGNRAFRDLVRSAQRMGGSLLAANIAKDFKEQAGSVLIGRTAETPQDLAVLAQVLRDPRFETFRIFFVKNGRIVHHTGITSRLPGSVDVVIQERGETAKQAFARFIANINNQMKASEADGYYLLHNHPSGRARASTADIQLTKQIAANLPGFRSHVIIDHNEYGEISVQELDDIQLVDEKVHKVVLTGGYSGESSLPHNVLQATISNAQELAGIGKHFEQSNEWFTLVGRSANGRVVSIAQMPMSALKKPDLWLLGALRRFARSSGAIRLMAVTEEQNLSRFENAVLNGVLLDVVSSDGSTSLRQRMQTARDDGLFGAGKRKAIQVKQDDMPADNILRSTQAEKAKSLSVEEVKQAINPLRARLLGSVKINVVQSTSDIPARVHERSVEDSIPADTDGVYDPAEKTVYLIADNIPSAERALWVALHETVGHAGLRSLGKDVQQTITYASKNKFVADLGRAIAKDRQQDYDAIHHNEEAIAELSAALLSDNVDAILERYGIVVPENSRKNLESIIERVVEAIRRFAAKVMGKVTDNQIRDLVMAAKVAVEGGRIESGKAANDYMRESLRLIRNGYRTVNDFIIPETPEYADNITGDLAYVPENDSIPVGPLRVEVGKATGEHRGFGITHIADNARRDSSRMPKKESGDFSEDLIREAVAVMRGARAVHHDGAYVFVNPSMKKAIVASYRNGYYSVTSVRPYKDPVFLWGNSEWTGSLRLPSHESAVNSPSFTDAGASDTPHPDRIRQEVSREKFTIPESNEKGQDKKQPTVTTKKRRNIEEPKLSSSPSLSKMLEDYKSIYNEMMSDEFINNNDFDKWVELRERADSIRMEISNKLESGRANGIGIDGDSLLSRNTTDPKNPWRITYLTKDGEPNGHSEYKSAKAAVDDFLTLSRTKKEMVLFSRAQTLANAGVNTTTTQAGKASTTLPEETKFQAFRRKTQDAMLRFKLVQEWLNEQGVNLTEEANVYQRENISKGKTANLIENFRNKELEPLIKDIAKAKFELGDIATYLEARHIPEANARMRQIHNDPNATANGITDQQAQKVLADFQAMPNFKEFEKLAGRVWNIGQETLDMRLDAGLISQEQYDAYKDTYKNWVPLRGNVNPQGFGKGLSTSHKDKRRMGHGFREDEFVLENLVQDRERAIMQVEKNKVSLSVLEFLMQANNPEIGTVGKPQKRATIKDHSYAIEYKGQVVGSFDNKGAADSAVLKILNGSSNLQLPGVASILPQDLKVVKTYDPRVVMMARPQLEDNEISVMINGSAVRMQLNDPLLARAGTAAGIEQVGSIIHAAREFNRFLSKAYTAFNPEFVVTNVMRDLYSGTIVLTGKRGAKFVTQVMQNYFPSIRDLWRARNDPSLSPWVERYRKAGGNVGASWLPDIERIGEDAMKALQEYAGARETYRMVYSEQIANGASKTKAKTIAIAKAGTAKLRAIPVFGKLFRVIERVNAVAENSLRLAAFRTAIENGESDQQAAFLSKETINFNRHGEINNTMSALWLFYNPAAQSIQLTGEALFSSKHKAQVWSLVGALTTLSFLLAEIGRGDDDDDEREYQNIPDHVKDRNLVFKFGDIQFTLAVAYGWGWFHTAGRLLSDYMHGEDGEKIAVKLAASFVENFSPMGNPVDEGDNETQFVPFQLLPTVAKIAVGPSVNLNSMGREIHPRKFSDSQPDSQLASRSVRGTIYQDLADFLNDATGGSKYEPGRISVSPDTIKFMVTSITGGAGKFVSDAVTGTMGVANGIAPTLKDTPIVRRFARESGVEDSRAAFWKTVKEVKSASERYNRALRDGDIFYAQNAIDTKQRIIALAEYANKYSAAAAMERDAILDIQKSEDMTKKEKSLRIKEIEIAERRLYDDFLRMFDVAKKIDE